MWALLTSATACAISSSNRLKDMTGHSNPMTRLNFFEEDGEAFTHITNMKFRFMVSNRGRIYNIRTGRFQKSAEGTRGYLKIGLGLNGKRFWFNIHRLVATYFVPGHRKGYVVDHIDREKTNNDFSNLRWISSRGNALNRGPHQSPLGHNIAKHGAGYRAQFSVNGSHINLPTRQTIQEAIDDRDEYVAGLDE